MVQLILTLLYLFGTKLLFCFYVLSSWRQLFLVSLHKCMRSAIHFRRDEETSCRVRSSGRSDGVMRTMNTEKLLKTIPIIQNQMDVLLDFNVSVSVLAALVDL